MGYQLGAVAEERSSDRVGLAGAGLAIGSACEIERRLRGASRDKSDRRTAAPTFVATCRTCQAMVASLVALARFPGWRYRRLTGLKHSTKTSNASPTGMATLQQMWEQLSWISLQASTGPCRSGLVSRWAAQRPRQSLLRS
ncbi:protein of unknown function [Pseudomonas sp. JV551A1]|uniref:Uncharacterized protein n=1 Tax=Pseudomonas inefficax TaxID=2078786 RepID=A0AAQ1SVN3_9PSED|nr:protein of unknown function [Pseudomonas sp. JV551A1]SPO63288.1 protein of unknown function [Pseudomonas inefficax]